MKCDIARPDPIDCRLEANRVKAEDKTSRINKRTENITGRAGKRHV